MYVMSIEPESRLGKFPKHYELNIYELMTQDGTMNDLKRHTPTRVREFANLCYRRDRMFE